MSALNYYIDLTPDRHHCPANMDPTAIRRVLLCDDCAAKIRDELSMDYADPIKHKKMQSLRCDYCHKNGFGDPATSVDLNTADVDPAMAAIDRAAGTLDKLMDTLDEISNPALFGELKDTRLELATREAELKEARQVIAARDDEIRRMRSELNGARNYADDVAGELGQAKQDVARFEAAWSQAMTDLGDVKRRHDQFLKVFDGMVDLGATLGRINSELDQLRLAMFKALTAAMAAAPTAPAPTDAPDPASPKPASVATDPATEGGEVDEGSFWARPMSDVAYLKARKLYDAGDISGAQRVILDDLIAQNRDKSMEWGKASTTESGAADVAGNSHE